MNLCLSDQWENAGAVIDVIHDIIFLTVLRGAHNANGFVERNENKVVGVTGFNQLAINFHDVTRENLIANSGTFTVNKTCPCSM